eukprot:gnl/Chilomastix_caulleri/5760.p1 GENE.gnl/Chilomastix_caulleri/5760~~gnl/Chilomastix_caulleri/5760.p1  ORF type:complete len:87 (+),score=5.38 gnl/Chilomastix_caulleri/5760:156-416(+)
MKCMKGQLNPISGSQFSNRTTRPLRVTGAAYLEPLQRAPHPPLSIGDAETIELRWQEQALKRIQSEKLINTNEILRKRDLLWLDDS